MKKRRLKYIHEVRFVDTDEIFDVIETKKAFRERMIKYFFENDEEPRELYFQLLESPNTTQYLIHPYIDRKGNPSIAFSRYYKPENEDECDFDNNDFIFS